MKGLVIFYENPSLSVIKAVFGLENNRCEPLLDPQAVENRVFGRFYAGRWSWGVANLESVDEADEADDEGYDAQASGGTAPRGASQNYHSISNMPVVSFEDDEMEEQERRMWQRLFVMENHRKYGTPLPLTEDMLSLHNARRNGA